VTNNLYRLFVTKAYLGIIFISSFGPCSLMTNNSEYAPN